MAYRMPGKTDEAMKLLNQALTLDPNFEPAKQVSQLMK